MKKIRINLPENGYNVYLGENIFSKLIDVLKKEKISGNIFLIIDSNVKKLYSDDIQNVFARYPYKVRWVVINSTEKNKSFQTVQKIHSRLIRNNYGRDSIIIALGGGIIGDIAGFASSTYMRGVKYIQIPTTLLAAVDSSVGGKTGINYEDTKNIIGTFYQPKFVLIDTKFFGTLNREERLCGIGEIVKYCFITDTIFFKYVNKNIEGILENEPSSVLKVVSESVKFKGSVVEADEKEIGIRKVLNLGHTFAHAFEIEQKHKLKHGQAVILGITCALYLSKEIKQLSLGNFEQLLDFLTKFRSKIKIGNVDQDKIYNVMQRDKKNRANEIRFVLIRNIGEIITDIPANKKQIYKSIASAISHFSK